MSDCTANSFHAMSPAPVTAVTPPGSATSDFRSQEMAAAGIDRAELLDARIMIIDDEELVIRAVQRFLSVEGFSNFHGVRDSTRAIDAIREVQPDVVLLDIMMPTVSGLDILRERRKHHSLQIIPFIILSASSEIEVKREALSLGAAEFLSKPVDNVDLVLRVQNSLIIKRHYDQIRNYATDLERQVQLRTRQIELSREQIVQCLAKAAEFRDNETGQHVVRVGKYAAVIAKQLGFGPNYCRQIELASQLHDVGKIGIPDHVLLNPGKLTPEQFEIMKQHCRLGVEIMEPLARAESDLLRRYATISGQVMDGVESPLLTMAANIARTHHEKWDGTGYPAGLRAEEIPIEGRITCVADVYDALCSERPYKPTYSPERCLEIMLSERGSRFDPTVLDAFLEMIEEINQIRQLYPDKPAAITRT